MTHKIYNREMESFYIVFTYGVLVQRISSNGDNGVKS